MFIQPSKIFNHESHQKILVGLPFRMGTHQSAADPRWQDPLWAEQQGRGAKQALCPARASAGGYSQDPFAQFHA
jgi:hypothetical protein